MSEHLVEMHMAEDGWDDFTGNVEGVGKVEVVFRAQRNGWIDTDSKFDYSTIVEVSFPDASNPESAQHVSKLTFEVTGRRYENEASANRVAELALQFSKTIHEELAQTMFKEDSNGR